MPRIADGLAGVWAQYTVRMPEAATAMRWRRAEGGGRADRGLLSEAAAPADGLSPLSVAGNGLPVSDRLAGKC